MAASNYEIERALDELPHIIGATCATAAFRASGEARPSREEYRRRAAEYFASFAAQLAADPAIPGLAEYIRGRIRGESERILAGANPQIERRYDRYVDYG